MGNRVFKSVFAAAIMSVSSVIPLHAQFATALDTSTPMPDQSQLFMSSNCEYALVVALWPSDGPTGNIPYVFGFPSRKIKLEVDVIHLGNETIDSFNYITSCDQFDPENWGGGRLSDQVEVDSDGDGTFESSSNGFREFSVTLPNRSNYIYPIYARWRAPSGELLVGKITVFVDVDCGISINDGAEYTNSRKVQVTINPCPGAEYVRISNDGGFKVRESADPGSTIDWTIPSNLNGVFTKVVYAKYMGGTGGTVTDDIILDTTTPTISSVTVANGSAALGLSAKSVTVKITASDTISGIGRMQITNNKARPGKWLKFAATSKFASNGSTLFVRVRDRAGNVSAWKSLALK